MTYLVSCNTVIRWCQQWARGWKPVALAFTFIFCGAKPVGAQSADSIQVGLQTFEHVQIQNKTPTHVFIRHAKGFAALKLEDLPMLAQQQLGLAPKVAPPANPKPTKTQASGTQPSTNSATAGNANATSSDTNSAPLLGFIPPQMVEQAETFLQPYREKFEQEILPVLIKFLWAFILGSVLAHLFLSFCFMLICQKASQPGTFLVWLPLFQMIPLFKAAKMSGWCFILLFIPLVNLILMIVWCFKICQALKKPAVLGFFLLLPVISLFALLYLAFSEGGTDDGGEVVKLDFAESTE